MSADHRQYSGPPSRNRHKIADLHHAARQQVDAVAPSLDLTTAFTARVPWGHGPERVKRTAADIIATTRLDIDRPLTDTEARSILRATRLRVSAEGQAHWLSVAVAAALWYRGIKTYRFPFYTPKRPPLGGGPLGHTLRMVAYTTICIFGMRPVEESIGLMGAMGAEEEDKKVLHEIGKEIKSARGMVMQGQTSGVQTMPQQSADQRHQAPQQSPLYTTRWPSDDQSQQQQQDQQQSSGSYTARWPDDPSTQYNPEPSQTTYQTSNSTTTEQIRSDRWSSPSIIDDASPIAPEESSPSSSNQPAGSSWARLRQQARSQQQQQQQGSWQQVRQSGAASADQQNSWGADDGSATRRAQPRESYAFSSADAERDLAKVQAQKEFDAMLERERRGDGGNQGGWR